MKTNDIRRVIDASLSGLSLTPEQREELFHRTVNSQKDLTPPRHKIGKLVLFAAVIALLAAALLAPAVSGTARQEEVVDEGDSILFRYNRIEGVTSYQAGAQIPEDTDSIWGTEFLTMLRLYSAQILLPKWCPEGYESYESRIVFDTHNVRVYLRKENERDIKLSIMVFDDTLLTLNSQVESIEGTAETWTYGGIEYHYSENYENSSVTWYENNCWAHLSGPRDRELMVKMIESIYE